ncbi:hypothetical protein ACFU3E_00300 [Streptomyces sp. NPDC057424]|uniref:hypothetical protein n=1 Tax=Streptomyces sp. NPDC057424 TaxID=3346127 RepID=UPI0036B945C0
MQRTTMIPQEWWEPGLVDVSRQCDARLPEVAASLAAAWQDRPLPERMQRALRRRVRRFHVEDQECDSRRPGGSYR